MPANLGTEAPSRTHVSPSPSPRVVTHVRGLAVHTVFGMAGTDAEAPDTVLLGWLGQAGFALRSGGRVHLIDPYLSDSLASKYAGALFPHRRLHPAPVEPQELRSVASVMHTHAHTDHLDPWTVRAVSEHNEPDFLVPRAVEEVALERHVPAQRLRLVDAGETVGLDGITVTAVPAAHEELTTNDRGEHHFLGYVVHIGGVRIYHSGDCVPYPGQAALLAGLDIDLALLPVNGRDEHRLTNGVPGNFTLDEAVRLCEEAGIPSLLCHHFGLFDFNTVEPGATAERLRVIGGELEWTVPAVGAVFRLTARRDGGRP